MLTLRIVISIGFSLNPCCRFHGAVKAMGPSHMPHRSATRNSVVHDLQFPNEFDRPQPRTIRKSLFIPEDRFVKIRSFERLAVSVGNCFDRSAISRTWHLGVGQIPKAIAEKLARRGHPGCDPKIAPIAESNGPFRQITADPNALEMRDS